MDPMHIDLDFQQKLERSYRIDEAALTLVLGMSFCALLYAIGSMLAAAFELGAFQ